MKIFVTGSIGSGSSTVAWLLSQTLQNYPVETLVVGKCSKGKLKSLFGLGDIKAPELTSAMIGQSGALTFDADPFQIATLPLDAALKQRFMALENGICLSNFVERLETPEKGVALVPSFGESLKGADCAVVVVEPSKESVEYYEKAKREAAALKIPVLLVLNKFEARSPKPVFDPAAASLSSDEAIVKGWWAGVTEMNHRELNRLAYRLMRMMNVASV